MIGLALPFLNLDLYPHLPGNPGKHCRRRLSGKADVTDFAFGCLEVDQSMTSLAVHLHPAARSIRRSPPLGPREEIRTFSRLQLSGSAQGHSSE